MEYYVVVIVWISQIASVGAVQRIAMSSHHMITSPLQRSHRESPR
jgi:hypothetical protein